jgi:hypothetical protein
MCFTVRESALFWLVTCARITSDIMSREPILCDVNDINTSYITLKVVLRYCTETIENDAK